MDAAARLSLDDCALADRWCELWRRPISSLQGVWRDGVQVYFPGSRREEKGYMDTHMNQAYPVDEIVAGIEESCRNSVKYGRESMSPRRAQRRPVVY